MTLTISVVIPTYKGEPFLTETVRSIVEQTCPPREIIVVDDHSPDGTCNLVEELARHSPIPLHLIRLEKNSGGPAHPLNVGMERAQSEFVALMDHDDAMLPNKLALQGRCFEQDPELVLVFSDYFGWCENHPDAPGMSPETWAQLQAIATPGPDCWRVAADAMTRLQLLNSGIIQSCSNLMFRRRLWQEGNQFDPSRSVIADFIFKVRATLQGPVGFIPQPLFKKRMHPTNLYSLSSMDKSTLLVYQEVLTAVEQHPRLLADEAFRAALRERLLAQAWFRRRKGEFLVSLALYWRCLRLFGFSWSICGQLLRAPLALVGR